MSVIKPFIAGAFAACIALPATANEFQPMLEALADAEIAAVLSNPALIDAIRAQNGKTAGLSEDEIIAMDQKWRSEIGGGATPTIDSVVASPVSDALRAAVEENGGLFTEVFIMDGVGLNVASSGITSDYWQGDEAKWQQTYSAGPGAVHFGDVEFDESTQTYQSQVSIAIVDPGDQSVIGAATFGVNVELLN